LVHNLACDICCSYNGNDVSSNMAVVAVNMVSGWLPDKDSVHRVINNCYVKAR